MDLLLKNGVYLDPETGEETNVTVGITAGKIEVLRRGTEAGKELSAEVTVDAKGAYVLPGMIDFHTHLFTHGSGFGVNADLLLSSGTTLAVDMGTAGTASYEGFHQTDVLPRTMKIKSFLNLSPVGQPGAGISEPLTETVIQEGRMAELIEKYPEEIRGIKVRISRELVGEEEIRPLERAVALGEKFGLPVCVHTTNPPVNTSEIVKRLRSGDIYSHMYHGKGKTVLREDGTVYPEFREAQKRGVYLEVGNGKMNFNFKVAKKAMADGIYPDIISSDATARTYGNAPDMKDLPYVMSKFWNLGMPLAAIFAAVTQTPARCLGISETAGYLKEGRTADLTLLRPAKENCCFSDSSGAEYHGERLLIPEMTMLDGRVVYLQGKAELKKGNV